MADEKLNKVAGDDEQKPEDFVAPETGGQQPVSNVEVEKPVEITINLDEEERQILAGAFSVWTAELQKSIEEAYTENREGKIAKKYAEELVVKIEELREKFNKLAPLLPYDIPDSE